MYSYEERLRAVELYVILGKRIGATIRQLGYPTKNSLKSWYQELLEHGDLHTTYARLKPAGESAFIVLNLRLALGAWCSPYEFTIPPPATRSAIALQPGLQPNTGAACRLV